METLKRTVAAIRPPDAGIAREAQHRLDTLTKPLGSLGRLEEIARRVAAMTGKPRPKVPRKVIYTLAADHGVAAEGVSAYPQEVTAQMVANFLRGGAGINVLARLAGARVVVVDIGVAADMAPHSALVPRKVRKGTGNLLREPAMTRDEAVRAVEAGIALVDEADLVGTGDMGIANTTPAAAITAVVTGRPVEQVTGRGTGIDDDRLRRKIQVIEQAIALHRPDPKDGIDVLSKVGGLEIAGLAGVMLGAAARRIPCVVDGFISGSAALIASLLSPAATDYLFAAHRSAEAGHRAVLERLGLEPILDLGLRLGEGTGAALAMHLVDASCRILDEMATFGEAGVSEKE